MESLNRNGLRLVLDGGYRPKARIPGCDPGDAVSRSVGHP